MAGSCPSLPSDPPHGAADPPLPALPQGAAILRCIGAHAINSNAHDVPALHVWHGGSAGWQWWWLAASCPVPAPGCRRPGPAIPSLPALPYLPYLPCSPTSSFQPLLPYERCWYGWGGQMGDGGVVAAPPTVAQPPCPLPGAPGMGPPAAPPPLPACLACHCTCQPLLQCLPWHQMDCTLSHRWWDQLGGAGVWGWWGWARVAAVLRGAACPCLPPSALPGLFAPPTLRACQPIMPAARDILRGVPGVGQLVQAGWAGGSALLPPPATRSPVPPAGPLPCLPCHPHLPSSAALGHVHHCYRLLPVNTGGGWWWGQLSGGGQGRHVPCRPPPATRPGAASRPPSPACPATLGCNAP